MKEITLPNGDTVIVDDDNFDKLTENSWYLSTNGYACRRRRVRGKREMVYMHREILGNPKNMQVDHINGNRLDNRKSNLRVATNAQNSINRKQAKGDYKGVYFSKANQKWIAQLKVNQKAIYLGSFDCERDAAASYNKAALEHFGEFAYLNDLS